MDRDELLKLAERCEQATGSDRKLEAAIATWHRPNIFNDAKERKWYAERRGLNRADIIYLHDIGVPAYTASLDAAKSLFSVNAGGRRIEMQETDVGAWVRLTWMAGGFSPKAEARARTLPLALTAAALRSIAAGEGK